MTVGAELRAAREQCGLSLRELSGRTNIRPSVLRAMEADDFARLPGGVITRGFLRLYAREVGLDPDATWRRCAEQVDAVEPDRPAGDGHTTELGGVTDVAATPEPRVRRAVMPFAGALAAIALLTAGYVVWTPSPDVADPAEEAASAPPAEPPTPAAPMEAAPAAAEIHPASTDPVPASAQSAGVLRVDLHATGSCWVSATADGAQVLYRQMNPGDRQAIDVSREIVLRVGMPGNLEVSLNGQSLPPPARPGTPITLRMTPENHGAWLRR